MAAPQYIPSFYFYKFAEGIAAPYTNLQAYKAEAIDASGNFIKPESSIDPLEYLIIKLKKIFEELPYGMTKSKLNNFLSTLQLFSEEASQFGITGGEYAGLVEGYLVLNGFPEVSYISLCEDMGASGMATPATSTGYNTGSVSGMDPVMAPMQRRQPVLRGLDSCEMFDVCPEEFKQFQGAESWKHVPESETKKYIRRYQLRNPSGNIALRAVDPDTGKSNVHWISLKPRSLKESYSSAEKEFANIAAQTIVNPPEKDIVPKTGKLKRGSRTQRVGYLLSGLRDLGKGGKQHQEKTTETLLPYAQTEVSASGIDTMAYDEKTGLFVPVDLKGDTTTPLTHVSDTLEKSIPGLPALSAKLKKVLERGPLSDSQKAAARSKIKEIGVRTPQENLRAAFREGILKLSPKLNWVVTPSTSSKKFLFPGLVTSVSPQGLLSYAETVSDPKLSARPGQSRFEYVLRGREPSVKEVADKFREYGSSELSPEDVTRALETTISPRLRRQLQPILEPYLKRKK